MSAAEENPVRRRWKLTRREGQINVKEWIKIKGCWFVHLLNVSSPSQQAQRSDYLRFPPFTSSTTSFSCVGVQLCSSRHFGLYRSVGDCVDAAVLLAGLATDTMTLASVHRFNAINTLGHSITTSCASEEERTKDCRDANQQKHTCRRTTRFWGSKGHSKTRVTAQASRISCDKDTIESGEKEEQGLQSCRQMVWL